MSILFYDAENTRPKHLEAPMTVAATPAGAVTARGDVTIETLAQRARDMIPTLRERSARCEELRRIPEENVADLIAAGLHRACQPTRFGGYGFGIKAIAAISTEIGRGCPSTAWMAGQWPGHQFMTGYFSDEAQHEYYATGPDTLSSTASAVAHCNAERVDGGLRVSAAWRFSSGCDHAQWILPTIGEFGLCLIPKSDFHVVDDWYVMGLEGTGSKQVVVENVFVPEHRVVPFDQLMLGTNPGASIYPDYPFYKAPMMLVLNTMLLGPTVGMTRGLLEIFESRVKTRVDGHTRKPAFERPGVQMRFAESAAEVDVAITFLQQVIAELRSQGSSGAPMGIEQRSLLRRNVAYSARMCMQAADRLLEYGDASGMYRGQDLQRWGRSIHMAGLQWVLTWDEPALAFSRVRWGLEPEALTT